MANRANIGRTLNDMIAAPAAGTTPKVLFKIEDGILECYGNTVPTNGSTGYAKSCTFHHIDGESASDLIYVNEGDATSCNFDSSHS